MIETKSLFATIVGKPNVGKSSLLNMILNQKISIVSHKPQTTRNKIAGIFTQENIQIVFLDTPGFLKVRSGLDKYMVKEIDDACFGVDLFIHVIEAGKRFSAIDDNIIRKIKNSNLPSILVINKIDLLDNKEELIPQIAEYCNLAKYECVVPVSCKRNDGREILLNEIKKLTKPSVFFYPSDEITDKSERFLVSEIIREKILKCLNQEVPHGIDVYVEYMKKRENLEIIDIFTTIYCNKEGHKSIIIGKNGDMLKKIGINSRKDIENMIGNKINLKLWVKVREGWKDKVNMLKSLGYSI